MTSPQRGFDRPFRAIPDVEVRRLSAVRIAEAILAAPDVTISHRRELLSIAVWKFTEADAGKWGLRFRSEGVLSGNGSGVQHEHVKPRKQLVDELLATGAPAEVFKTAIACLVTREEHQRLSVVDPELLGWQRYAAAGIQVWDMAATPPRLLDGADLASGSSKS